MRPSIPLLALGLGLMLATSPRHVAAQSTQHVLHTQLLRGDDELARADDWISKLAEARARRQSLERWGVPVVLGGMAAIAGASAAVLDVKDSSRAMFGASAALAVGGMIPSILRPDPERGRWLAAGASASAAAYGAAVVLDSIDHDSCTGFCGNERPAGWLGGALMMQSVLLVPMAFVDRGPSLLELQRYRDLPEAERPKAARRLLARIDRAERKAAAISMSVGLLSSFVFAAGAAAIHDADDRRPVLVLGGLTLGIATITGLAALLKTTRLERFTAGKSPRATERILW